jgi:hypothetical protein
MSTRSKYAQRCPLVTKPVEHPAWKFFASWVAACNDCATDLLERRDTDLGANDWVPLWRMFLRGYEVGRHLEKHAE